jgi:uncharacterized protein YcgI (DUF1989 family)
MRDAFDFRRKFPTPASTLQFYERVRAAKPNYLLVDKFEVPSPTGRAFIVKAGQIARFLISHGPQIVDLDVFNVAHPHEHLWANQTLNREGFWLTTFSRLWSNMPWFRPLATIVEDTIKTDHSQGPARHHHIFGGYCNPFYWYISTGKHDLPNCYENLCTSIGNFGLAPEAVHDNLNLFQKSILTSEGVMKTVRSDARIGDYVDFYAELDLLLAASLCPRGSGGTEPSDRFQERYPITVQIFDSGIVPVAFNYETIVLSNRE